MAGGTDISKPMNGDARILPIHRKQYQNSVIELMSNNSGGKLRKYCIVQNCRGNTSTIFNTVEGTEINRTGDFEQGRFVGGTNGNQETENNDFKFGTVEVAPAPIYAGNWVHETQYEQTMLNIDSAISETQVRSLGVEEDKDIIKAIKAVELEATHKLHETQYEQTMLNIDSAISETQVRSLGVEEDKDIIKAIKAVELEATHKFGSSEAPLTLKTFVEAIDWARLFLGTGTPIAILANKKDIAKLRTEDGFKALSSDYAQYFGVQKPGTDDIATGELITWRHDLLEAGEMYFLADRVMGLATWNDNIGTSISYKDEKSKYLLKAWTSLGVKNLDKLGVFKVEFQAA